MKVFIKKIFVCVVISVTLVNVVYFFLPFYWGNPSFGAKYKKMKQKEEIYNCVSFGSSKTYRHIIPSVFDSIVGSGINSYNLGFDATYSPETYHLLKNFIKEDYAQNIDYIFLELGDLRNLRDNNRSSSRVKYALDIHNLCLLTKHSWINNRKESAANYLFAYTEKLFGINCLRDALKSIIEPDKYYIESAPFTRIQVKSGIEFDGFRELIPNDQSNRLLKNAEGRSNKNMKYNKNIFAKRRIAFRESQIFHYNDLMEIIDICKKADIHLFITLPPKASGIDIISLFMKLPNENKIELADPNKYIHLYDNDLYYNYGHFNKAGANKYSTELAKQFLIKINKN